MELREPTPRDRHAPLDLVPEEFRRLGHSLVAAVKLTGRELDAAMRPRELAVGNPRR